LQVFDETGHSEKLQKQDFDKAGHLELIIQIDEE